MTIKEKLYRFLFLKHIGIKNLNIYRPTKTSISNNANFNITTSLTINVPDPKGHNVGITERYTGLPSTLSISDDATINCEDFTFYQCCIGVGKNAVLNLGKNSFMNKGGTLVCRQLITIGNGTFIGHNVEIRDTDSHNIVGSPKTIPVTIGNHVWIGSKSIILKGVTIGDNTVIGAGSVVTHNLPSNCIAVGNPAKVIRENTNWIE